MADVEALYAANHNRLFRYFCRAVGHVEDAHELTHDVFLRVARTVVPAGPELAQRAWLFQIARNLVLDHQRKGRRGRWLLHRRSARCGPDIGRAGADPRRAGT